MAYYRKRSRYANTGGTIHSLDRREQEADACTTSNASILHKRQRIEDTTLGSAISQPSNMISVAPAIYPVKIHHARLRVIPHFEKLTAIWHDWEEKHNVTFATIAQTLVQHRARMAKFQIFMCEWIHASAAQRMLQWNWSLGECSARSLITSCAKFQLSHESDTTTSAVSSSSLRRPVPLLLRSRIASNWSADAQSCFEILTLLSSWAPKHTRTPGSGGTPIMESGGAGSSPVVISPRAEGEEEARAVLCHTSHCWKSLHIGTGFSHAASVHAEQLILSKSFANGHKQKKKPPSPDDVKHHHDKRHHRPRPIYETLSIDSNGQELVHEWFGNAHPSMTKECDFVRHTREHWEFATASTSADATSSTSSSFTLASADPTRGHDLFRKEYRSTFIQRAHAHGSPGCDWVMACAEPATANVTPTQDGTATAACSSAFVFKAPTPKYPVLQYTEEISFPMVYAQYTLALQCLRAGGGLVLRCFGLLSEATRQLVYHATQSFEWLALHQPSSVSLHNLMECYLLCTGFRGVLCTNSRESKDVGAAVVVEQLESLVGEPVGRMASWAFHSLSSQSPPLPRPPSVRLRDEIAENDVHGWSVERLHLMIAHTLNPYIDSMLQWQQTAISELIQHIESQHTATQERLCMKCFHYDASSLLSRSSIAASDAPRRHASHTPLQYWHDLLKCLS